MRSVLPSARFVSTKTVHLASVISLPPTFRGACCNRWRTPPQLCSTLVRLCYKNARFVTSGPLWLAPGVRIAGSLFVRERTASPLPKPRVLDRASSSLGLHAVWGGRRSL